jgi:hypothetical protein
MGHDATSDDVYSHSMLILYVSSTTLDSSALMMHNKRDMAPEQDSVIFGFPGIPAGTPFLYQLNTGRTGTVCPCT